MEFQGASDGALRFAVAFRVFAARSRNRKGVRFGGQSAGGKLI